MNDLCLKKQCCETRQWPAACVAKALETDALYEFFWCVDYFFDEFRLLVHGKEPCLHRSDVQQDLRPTQLTDPALVINGRFPWYPAATQISTRSDFRAASARSEKYEFTRWAQSQISPRFQRTAALSFK
ncbi:MAG: hypothetical protein AAGM21_16300 [Pseudomonadota bacterium]